MQNEQICYNCFQARDSLSGPCPHCGFDLTENEKKYPVALRAGTVLNDRYIVGRVLGQGGFGITYLAWDTQLEAKVAIKEFMPGELATRVEGTTVSVLSADRSEDFTYGAERFQEEARTLAKFIGNPNIAAVTSYFDENDTSYFVMDYIEGISFKTYIANHGGKVSVEDTLNVMIPVLRALTAVHQEGFIHRDVTPDNIYITKDGMVKLLDFGSARYSIGDKSKSLDVILKVGYAPKEQYIRRSRQGPYTDVYSCAACFYAALTGFLPPEALERLDRDELVPVSQCGVDIPEYLDKAILKGLAVQPEDRFQSAEEFLNAIESQQVVEVPQAGAAQPAAPAKKKLNPVLIGGVAAAVAVVLGIGVAIGGNSSRSGGEAGGGNSIAEALAPTVTIGGEEYSTALEELDLSGKNLTDADLTNLSQMSSLKFLDLRDNPITDLSPIAGLTELEEFAVTCDQIGDLSPLSGLVNLEILRLAGDESGVGKFTDLTPLRGLTNLRTLHLPANGPTSLDGLEDMTQLTDLALISGSSSNIATVQNIDALAGLTEMKELHLQVTGISDLTPLAGMTELQSLQIGGNLAVSDLSPLAGLTKLQEFEFYNNEVAVPLDLAPLAGMTEMINLRVPCTVPSLEPLRGMTKLQSLRLSDKHWYGRGEGILYDSLEPLSGLTALTRLELRSDEVTDLSPLAALTNLQSLELHIANATDLTPLSGLDNLNSLMVDGQNITDWSPVEHVPNLIKS